MLRTHFRLTLSRPVGFSIAHGPLAPVVPATLSYGLLPTLRAARSGKQQVSTRKDALMLEDEASVVCSAPYRPPELTSVEPGAVIDERVDVWALGCTLYAMAFGHSPFESPR